MMCGSCANENSFRLMHYNFMQVSSLLKSIHNNALKCPSIN